MSYMKIPNLYKDQTVLLFKQVYCLEKCDGTSANISYNNASKKLVFFSGGASHENFVKLFNQDELLAKFQELFGNEDFNIVVYGEAYGGKIQGMSKVYGKDMRFVAFEVRVGDTWLDVPNAHDVVSKLGLEFVHYVLVDANIEVLNKERDRDSVQSIRNGMGSGHDSEGIVIRPPIEVKLNNGSRIIAKHKKDKFRETKTPRVVDENQQKVLEDANQVATEWVTLERLKHVADSIQKNIDVENIRLFIPAMIKDIQDESEGEIVWSKDCERSIGKKTAELVKIFCKNHLTWTFDGV